jgi:hypothetical protein
MSEGRIQLSADEKMHVREAMQSIGVENRATADVVYYALPIDTSLLRSFRD